LRMLLAVLCGGIIGIEREFKRRPAGFRTHILICLGAAMTTLTGQYLLLDRGYYTDLSRLGAQVIAGIGFIGAGTIIVTSHQRVKGLTTAAGLWTAAIVGLCIGAGFYEVVILSFVIIVLCIKVFPVLEELTVAKSRNMNVYLEFERLDDITNIIRHIKGRNIRVMEVDIDRANTRGVHQRPNAILTLQLPGRQSHALVLAELTGLACICAIEEI